MKYIIYAFALFGFIDCIIMLVAIAYRKYKIKKARDEFFDIERKLP